MNFNHAAATRERYLSRKDAQMTIGDIEYTIYDVLITPPALHLEEFRQGYASNLDNEKALYRFLEDRNLELRLWALNIKTNKFELLPFEYDEYPN